MCNDEKKTEKLGVWMSPSLMLELTRPTIRGPAK